MSYDVYLHVDRGSATEEEVFCANYTSNTAPMWRRAGCDLAEFEGKPASEIIFSLDTAVHHMHTWPEIYTPMNPENGWGDYEGTLAFLESILRACFIGPQSARYESHFAADETGPLEGPLREIAELSAEQRARVALGCACFGVVGLGYHTPRCKVPAVASLLTTAERQRDEARSERDHWRQALVDIAATFDETAVEMRALLAEKGGQ